MEDFFYKLAEEYGLYAVFLLTMIEGDITLLLGGVLAHGAFFAEYSFLKVLLVGTLAGVVGDNIAYGLGRGFRTGVRDFRFYRAARPRLERLTENFGPLSIFLSKYIYGLRTASCVFYGVARMPYNRFLPLTLASCFVWVLTLSGAGYFFSSAVINLIGDFHRLGKFLLVIVVAGVVGFYLAERYWLSKKVEEADPERIHKLEQAAEEKLHEIGHEIQEHLPGPLARRKDPAKPKHTVKRSEAEGD
ncbi:MAG: DedA family protein [Acidobacteria bacterium]|nr:DedA family protein [Acidobacteriota bacterium]